MTGSGTSADPYVVTTWRGLVNVARQSNKYIRFPVDQETINIEDEFGKDEPPQLVIAGGVDINGNGWTIHGLWGKTHDCIKGSSSNSLSSMRNFNFSSFHSQSNYFIKGGEVPITLENCIFSGICEKNFLYAPTMYFYGGTYLNQYIYNCSTNIQFTSLGTSSFLDISYNGYDPSSNLYGCNIKLKAKGNVILFNGGSMYTDITNCLFNVTSENNITIFSSSTTNTKISGCMFIGGSQSKIDIGNGTPQTINVFDEAAFPNAVRSTKLVGVPHADIDNAEYLSSIGFPIGVRVV